MNDLLELIDWKYSYWNHSEIYLLRSNYKWNIGCAPNYANSFIWILTGDKDAIN